MIISMFRFFLTRLYKKIQMLRAGEQELLIIPTYDIDSFGESLFVGVGDDPQFQVEMPLNRKFTGWMRFRCHGSHVASCLRPRFYADCGGGYIEVENWLVKIQEHILEGVICLPANTLRLRFDPADIPGSFQISRLSLQSIFGMHACLLLSRTIAGKYLDWNELLGLMGRLISLVWQQKWIEIARCFDQLPSSIGIKRDYAAWIKAFDQISEKEYALIRDSIERIPWAGKISVLMQVDYADPVLLQKAIASVQLQIYEHWELCISFEKAQSPEVGLILKDLSRRDARIQVHQRVGALVNGAICNAILAQASGDYVTFLAPEDELSVHAFYMVAFYISRNPHAHLLYSDEDKINMHGLREKPHFKPDWNQELLFSQDYLGHLRVYRRSEVSELSHVRHDIEGIHSFELLLRMVERSKPGQIVHIPFILYHNRLKPGSPSRALDANRIRARSNHQALSEHFQRLGLEVSVRAKPDGKLQLVFPDVKPEPKLSIIIPNRDRFALISKCLEGLLKRTNYQNFEVILVDNDSIEHETLEFYETVLQGDSRVRLLSFPGPFNYSAINNMAALEAQGHYLIFLNNDTEVFEKDWLQELVKQLVRPGVGAVGARLYYPDFTLQHGGVIMGLQGIAGHAHRGLPSDAVGYFNRGRSLQNYSAVTGACLGVSRQLFMDIGGFDAENLPVDFNDIDLCLRIGAKGLRIIWAPDASLLHYESASRGKPGAIRDPSFFHAVEYMKMQWKGMMWKDPAYNPNLDLTQQSFALAFPPRVEKPWLHLRQNIRSTT